MKIDEVSEEDLHDILVLQVLAFQVQAEIYNDYTLPPLVQTLEEVQNDFLQQVFLKTERDGKIIGSVRGYKMDDTGYIGRLIVHPDYQNQGIGKALMTKIEGKFSNLSRFEIFTGHKSEKNLYLYKNLGYKTIKEEVVDDNLTMVYLEKKKN